MSATPRLTLTADPRDPVAIPVPAAVLDRPLCYTLPRAPGDPLAEVTPSRDAARGASIFAIGRRGELLWCTPSAQRDLKQVGARHAKRPGRLSPFWAYHLWNPIHTHSLEYQIAPLDNEALPCRGRVAWSPARPLELTASIWRLRPVGDDDDPVFHRLVRRMQGLDGGDDRPAA